MSLMLRKDRKASWRVTMKNSLIIFLRDAASLSRVNIPVTKNNAHLKKGNRVDVKIEIKGQ
jgi:hypothetical protein